MASELNSLNSLILFHMDHPAASNTTENLCTHKQIQSDRTCSTNTNTHSKPTKRTVWPGEVMANFTAAGGQPFYLCIHLSKHYFNAVVHEIEMHCSSLFLNGNISQKSFSD